MCPGWTTVESECESSSRPIESARVGQSPPGVDAADRALEEDVAEKIASSPRTE